MQFKALTAKYHVSNPINADVIPLLADQGFAKIICNLQDGEIDGQPDNATLSDIATTYGIDFVYIPVTVTAMTPQVVLRHTKAVIETEGPVLAYCATGRRCAMLWALEFSDKYSQDRIMSQARAIGYDFSSMRQKLDTFQPLPSGVPV
jgi:uncharacterized protein (TIGR01244 family)